MNSWNHNFPSNMGRVSLQLTVSLVLFNTMLSCFRQDIHRVMHTIKAQIHIQPALHKRWIMMFQINRLHHCLKFLFMQPRLYSGVLVCVILLNAGGAKSRPFQAQPGLLCILEDMACQWHWHPIHRRQAQKQNYLSMLVSSIIHQTIEVISL